MSLFTYETHAANPPDTWRVVKVRNGLWAMTTKDGDRIATFRSKKLAEHATREGSYVALYNDETRWYAGEQVRNWKPFVAPTPTPRPWRIGDAGFTVFGPPNGKPAPEVVAHCNKRENARLIVEIVNGNEVVEKLVRACELTVKCEPMQQGERNGAIMGYISTAIDAARHALAAMSSTPGDHHADFVQ